MINSKKRGRKPKGGKLIQATIMMMNIKSDDIIDKYAGNTGDAVATPQSPQAPPAVVAAAAATTTTVKTTPSRIKRLVLHESGSDTSSMNNIILHLRCSMEDAAALTSSHLTSYNEADDNSNTTTNKIKKKPCLLGCKYNGGDDDVGGRDGDWNNELTMETTTTTSTGGGDIMMRAAQQQLIDDRDASELSVAAIKKKMAKINNYKSKPNCFWCTCEFDNEACHIPKCEVDGTIECYGVFCRAECAAGFLMGEFIDDSSKMERYNLLNEVYGKIFRYVRAIKPAPAPFYLLDKFCGNLSIHEYRKILQSDSIVTVIDKPMTRVFPELHEDNEEFTTNVFRKKPPTNSNNISNGNNNIIPTTTFKVKRQSKKVKEVNKNSILQEAFFA